MIEVLRQLAWRIIKQNLQVKQNPKQNKTKGEYRLNQIQLKQNFEVQQIQNLKTKSKNEYKLNQIELRNRIE